MSQRISVSRVQSQFAVFTTIALIALLALYWAKFAYNAWLVLLFPGQLDYVEGEVWQQARLIPGPRMYADFQQSPPFIGFEYPPVYHLVVRGLAYIGVPWLVAGRFVSMLSALAIAALTAGIVRQVSELDTTHPENSRARLVGAVLAGMILIMFQPFQFWSYTMRVDVLAVALELSGIYLGLMSLRRPRLIYASALAFVLAVYTKQNTLAGLLATLSVLALHTPARAFRASVLATAVGLFLFGGLTFATGGGFFRHIIVYDVNRFTLQHALQILGPFLQNHVAYLLICLISAAAIAAKYVGRPIYKIPPGYLLVLFYLALTTVSAIQTGKFGANTNYLISWVVSWAIITGSVIVAIAPPGKPAYSLMMAVLLVTAGLDGPKFGQARVVDPKFRREYAELIQKIRLARKPVLSDDMVLLSQAGKEIPWEPFLITELTGDGKFDEQRIVALIKERHLAFAVVRGEPGQPGFVENHSPAVAAALAEAYPTEHRLAGMRVLEADPGN